MHHALKKREAFTTVAYVKTTNSFAYRHLLVSLLTFAFVSILVGYCYVDVADYQNIRLVCVNDESLSCEV